MQFLGALSHLAEVTKGRRSVTFPWVRKVSVGAHTSFAHPCPGNPLTQGQHRGRFCVHFLAALPHLTAGGRHAFRLIASSVRTNFAEERGEVDFSPPLAQFGSTHAVRLLLIAWVVTLIPGARPAAPVCQALPAGAPVAGLTARCFQMGGSAARRGCAPPVRASQVRVPRRTRGTQFSLAGFNALRA